MNIVTLSLHLLECKDTILDIYFVVDISKSISEKELIQEREAVRYLINSFDIDKDRSRVGLIKYHHITELEFSLGKYATRQELNSVKVLTRHHDMKGEYNWK